MAISVNPGLNWCLKKSTKRSARESPIPFPLRVVAEASTISLLDENDEASTMAEPRLTPEITCIKIDVINNQLSICPPVTIWSSLLGSEWASSFVADLFPYHPPIEPYLPRERQSRIDLSSTQGQLPPWRVGSK